MNLERRFIEARAETDEAGGIHGYGAVFFRADEPGTEYRLWDKAVERIMPGAFDRAAREDDVRALFNHDPSWVLGRTKSGTLTLSIDDTGLRYDVTPSDTRPYQDVQAMLKRGDVDGSSFSFVVTQERWITEEDREIRQIEAVELYDVGPVTYPAYASTQAWVRGDDIARRSRDAWAEHLKQQRDAVMRDRVAAERVIRAAQIRLLT